MHDFFTPQLIMALIGGVAGGFFAATNEIFNTRFGRIADFLVGLVAAAGSIHFLPPGAKELAFIYGLVAGALSSAALDIIYGMLPNIIKIVARIKLNLDIKDKDKDK